MIRQHRSVTLQQASLDSPTLARLADLTRESSARLKAIETLIPRPLRPAIQAGPIEGTVWCVLVDNNAVAAKLRQLLPNLLNGLKAGGWQVTSIRLKVQIRSS